MRSVTVRGGLKGRDNATLQSEKQRHGFTAEPLFDEIGRRRLLETGAAVLSLSPDARPVHEEPKFTGSGGEFGGGGSSSGF